EWCRAGAHGGGHPRPRRVQGCPRQEPAPGRRGAAGGPGRPGQPSGDPGGPGRGLHRRRRHRRRCPGARGTGRP
ncbi:MAG: N-Acetylneuraminate cytidylyltransferase, partial [uncultured Friedmanniella sp.]